MNVAFDPWIPVVTAKGKRELVSLSSVLTEGERIADLAVRPHERVALMRLFLCVAHAALDGPKDYSAWCEVPKRLPEASQRYLTKWKDWFELFHKERPWLQVAGLSKNVEDTYQEIDAEGWTPVSKLNFSFATGNNSTLFDHGGMGDERLVSIGETILSMLTFQCFSPGGLISQVYWNGVQSGKSSKDGPCVPASMVHAFLRGKDLGSTVHINLPTYEQVKFSYGERDIGRPVWEMPPVSMNDPSLIANATTTYVGRLVPMTRLIRLHPSGGHMLLGDGLVYPPFTEGFPPEPTACVYIRKKGNNEERALLSYRPAKSLWRELGAIIVKRNAYGTGGPLSLRAIQDGDGCDLVVAALARDQATIIDTAESVFHIPPELRTEEGTIAYEAEVKAAESCAARLGWAVEDYRREFDGGWDGRLKGAGPNKGALKMKLHSIAWTHYWTGVEGSLSLLMAHIVSIGTDGAVSSRDAWQKMLFATACDAYRTACGQKTPRQMRAFAKGWQKLTAKVEPTADPNEQKEEKV